MKKLTIVLVLALALVLPLLAGCGENVKVVLPSLNGADRAAVRALTMNGTLELHLAGVHVHNLSGQEAYNFGNVTIDLVEWLKSEGGYAVCSGNLPAGNYKDLGFALTNANWSYDIDGSWDLGVLGTVILDYEGQGTHAFDPAIPVHITTLPLVVHEDGTSEWTWMFNLSVVSQFQGTGYSGNISGSTGFGLVWSN